IRVSLCLNALHLYYLQSYCFLRHLLSFPHDALPILQPGRRCRRFLQPGRNSNISGEFAESLNSGSGVGRTYSYLFYGRIGFSIRTRRPEFERCLFEYPCPVIVSRDDNLSCSVRRAGHTDTANITRKPDFRFYITRKPTLTIMSEHNTCRGITPAQLRLVGEEVTCSEDLTDAIAI